ncbi:MAG: CHC2 zinc finger domain-containing protein [Prevotella sp.]
MERYELQKLRDLPIEGVAQRLGLRVVRHKALCPFHEDRHPSLSFNLRKNTFRCFVCDAHGGTIDLAMQVLSRPFREACQWLAGEHNVILTEWKPAEKADAQKPFDAARYERFLERPWLSDEARRFLFDERKLDARVVRWCRVSSWRDRNGVNWLQTPFYDVDGKLTGVQNRNLQKGASPRFRFPYGSRCGIYNLPVLNMLRPGEELWITEGCSDCWAMLSSGRKAIAIPSATLLSQKDKDILSTLSSQLSTEFHMYPDRDAPGERLFLQLKQVLPTLQHHQLPQGCKDYAEYYCLTRQPHQTASPPAPLQGERGADYLKGCED